MSNVVRNEVGEMKLMSYKKLKAFQGNLKSLSQENYEKLKALIIKHGFSAPFFAWAHEGKLYSLDGHQRCRTLSKMEQEGWHIPDLPVVHIYAASIKEAREKLLAFASQYGKVEGQGLYEFIEESGGLDVDEVLAMTAMPEVDPDLFKAEYYETPDDNGGGSGGGGGQDAPTGDPQKEKHFDHVCPKCGFGFN